MTHVCEFCGYRIDHANNGHAIGCGRESPKTLPPVTAPPPDAPVAPRVADDKPPA